MISSLLKYKNAILLFILFTLQCSLYGFDGIYITPKFSFYPYLPEYKNNGDISYEFAIGYGLSLGYDFSKLNKNTPFRCDIEYLGNISLTQVKFRTDYILLNGYYDIYFFDYNDLKNQGKKFLSSLYIGFNFGLSIISEFGYSWYEKNTQVKARTVTYRNSILGGLNAGFVWHIKEYIGIDIGYKWIVSPLIRNSHEVLLGVRFNIIGKAKSSFTQ